MSEKRFERWNDNSCKVKDNQEDTLLNWEDVVNKLNEQQDTISRLEEENEQLKKSEKINMEYAEQIVEENQKLRIAKNDLRIENEQLHLAIDDLLSHTSCEEIKKENEQLKKEYKIAINEMATDYRNLEKENEQLKSENKKLEQQYHNLVNAIVKTCNDLGKENIYLGDFDICKRITEYEKE